MDELSSVATQRGVFYKGLFILGIRFLTPSLSFRKFNFNLIYFLIFFFLNLFWESKIIAQEYCESFSIYNETGLMSDLIKASQITNKLNERLPVLYNHLLQGGYFSMPSARMGKDGEMAVGWGEINPYRFYSVRFQLVNFLEVTGNYRIFKGVKDPVLTETGFGDFSDKGANLKLSLFEPEVSHYQLPGLAIGIEDFIGTSAFCAHYIVLTQVFLKYHLEISLGYGAKRIRGWFGGVSWMPFRYSDYKFLNSIALVAEYDAIPYRDIIIEPHPKGRVTKNPFNFGAKIRLWDSVDLSLACIRGHALAFTVSSFYDFGHTKGLIPKIEEKFPYRSPINTQEIGELRPQDVLVEDLLVAFNAQGFEIIEMWMTHEENNETLRIRVINNIYRVESHVRARLNALISALIPNNVDEVIVSVNSLSVPIQEYHYLMKWVNLWKTNEVGSYELMLLTPLKEASSPNPYDSELIFKQPIGAFNFEVLPKTHTLFGSSKGKFKYALGLSFNFNGFILNDLYYTISLGWFAFSNLWDVSDFDRLNPSQIINVRTDIINYFKQKTVIVDEAFIEKIWNFGRGFYARLAVGLFEVEYGGVATEVLWYPIQSNWALGAEVALLKKRTFSGVGFTNKIRKLDNFRETYKRFLGSQCFLNLYYEWEETGLDFKFSAGKFLANDLGLRTIVSRFFPSGLQLGFWYTYTNAKDSINGKIYHDKGLYFTLPLDIFYTRSSRTRWGYGMAAWLRDVGASALTGTDLYYLINENR